MKFALLTVTYGGLFYKGEALSLEQQIYKAKELGFDALAIETKRPVASPLDLTRSDRDRIKKISADQNIPLCAIESMSNFAGRYMEDRENNLAMMRMVLELAKDLGVDLVKIFVHGPASLTMKNLWRCTESLSAATITSGYFPPICAAGTVVWKEFAKQPTWPQTWVLHWHFKITHRY
jgi:sugar phosphate isomerase/epimerase